MDSLLSLCQVAYLFGLPILYLEMGYEHDLVMDVLWIYSAYLVVIEIYRRFIVKTYCDDNCKK